MCIRDRSCELASGKQRGRRAESGTSPGHAAEVAAAEAQELERQLDASGPLHLPAPNDRSKPLDAEEW
eukprot:238216-Alexandrium_andersonii.AAC.1